MPTPDVIDRVRALHDQLENEPNAALEPVRPQLQRIAREPHDAGNYQSLSDGLQSAYESLEVEHPTLAAMVRATMNALTAAGL
jgi:hypothetical protein